VSFDRLDVQTKTSTLQDEVGVRVVSQNGDLSMTIPRILGYARVSTQGQDLSYQIGKLKAAGCTRVFQEKRSGKSRDRPELKKLLAAIRPGDTVLATVTDRIARDPLDMLNILQAVKDAGAALRLLDEPFIDTSSELSDLLMFIIGWAARWQRRRILENTAHGRELARKQGVKFGRKPKFSIEQKNRIRRQYADGASVSEIAKSASVSLSTVRRAVN
jgi:DNA invertase Pin-like site-specific DNA recombinase